MSHNEKRKRRREENLLFNIFSKNIQINNHEEFQESNSLSGERERFETSEEEEEEEEGQQQQQQQQQQEEEQILEDLFLMRSMRLLNKTLMKMTNGNNFRLITINYDNFLTFPTFFQWKTMNFR